MTAYSSLVLASSPRAYYRFDEVAGITAFDQTSNKYHGTIKGGVTPQQQNAIITDYTDYCYLFNGTNGYVALPTGLKTDGLAALSIECWFYLTNNTFVNNPFMLANDPNPLSTHIGFRFNVAPASDGYGGHFMIGNGTTGVDKVFGQGVYATGKWNHVVAVYDGTNVLAYVNGLADIKTTILMSGTVGTALHPLAIGAYPPASIDFFPGYLDEIAIYPSALSATTILNHYNTGNFGRSGITPFPPLIRRNT